jgi:hypothetical protein
MADDLYTTWLEIPPGPRPPDHYALLGLPRFTADREKIEQAAHLQLHRLDRFALHPDKARRDECQRMMNEVARARVVLVNPERRAAYDRDLGGAAAPVRKAVSAPVVTFPVPRATFPVPVGLLPLPVVAEEPPAELWQLAHAASTARRTRGPRVGLLQLVPALFVVTALAVGAYFLMTRAPTETARKSPEHKASPANSTAPATRALPVSRPVETPLPPPTTPASTTAPAVVAAAPRTVVPFTQADMTDGVRLDRTDVTYEAAGTLSPPAGLGPFTLTIGPGVEFKGGTIDLKRVGRLEIEGSPDQPAVLRNVKVLQDLGARVNAKYAVFERCTFAKGGAWFSRYSSKWSFDGCLLYACAFPRLTGVDYGFRWSDCTFVSMDFPEIEPQRPKGAPFDHMRHLRTEWNSVNRCRFVNCTVRPTMVWCATESNYAACRFVAGRAFASDQMLAASSWLAETVDRAPWEAWAEAPPERAPVYFVAADKPYDVFSFKDPLPVADLRDPAARKESGLDALDADLRATQKPAEGAARLPSGRTVVFVCDASGFMAKRFDTLRGELSKAVLGLKREHKFNIVFFQGERPEALGDELMAATSEQKVAALKFVHSMPARGARDSLPALRLAFGLQPQLVYLLTTEDEAQLLRVEAGLAGMNADKRVRINVLRFRDDDASKDESEAVLQRIARDNGGVYRLVDPQPTRE